MLLLLNYESCETIQFNVYKSKAIPIHKKEGGGHPVPLLSSFLKIYENIDSYQL